VSVENEKLREIVAAAPADLAHEGARWECLSFYLRSVERGWCILNFIHICFYKLFTHVTYHRYACEVVKPQMEALRVVVDAAETKIAHHLYPYPKYEEVLYDHHL
jgi:hypothetical protein